MDGEAMEHALHSLVGCHGCDLVQRAPELHPGESAHCVRCGTPLYRRSSNAIERSLALSVTALFLWLVANGWVFMTFAFKGSSNANYIFTGIVNLYQNGAWPLAALVAWTSAVSPVLYLVGILFVLVPLQRGRRPAAMGPLVRTLTALRPWVMLEVYVLGALVAVVKLAQLASIDLDLGAYAFGLLIVVWTASVSLLDWRDVWERAGEIERRA